MARVVEGFHSFTCTPTRLSTNEMNHTCLCISSRSWYSFTEPGGMKGWVGLTTNKVIKQSVQNRYVTAITVVSCSSLIGHREVSNSRPRRPQAAMLSTEQSSRRMRCCPFFASLSWLALQRGPGALWPKNISVGWAKMYLAPPILLRLYVR